MKTRFALLLLGLLVLPACGRAHKGQDMNADTDKMAAEHQHDQPNATEAATTPPAQEVTAEEVTYATVGGKPVRGYLARPQAAQGALPGLIVIHEWWGLNDNIRNMTKRLAGEGYAALAVDLYGGQVADTPDRAQQLMGGVLKDLGTGEENVKQAYQYLETQQKAPKIGVIGWCFGGGWSLATAMALPDKIDAVVMYYGRIETDKAKLAPVQAPILGLFGGKDQSIPVASVRDFEKALKDLGKDARIHVYDDANHAFANPSGGNYNATAAQDAWQKTTAFLAQHLR